MRITLWHNPRCSKSRQARELLEQAGAELDVIEYLDHPPTAAELTRVLGMLGIGARELARRSEGPWRELGLDGAGNDAIIAAMVDHPILIERPVAIAGDRAVIGRPPERVRELLG
jgi:arsenate reductase